MTTFTERAMRVETELTETIAKLDRPIRIYRPAPFQPGRRLSALEARLLSASNGLTDTTKLERLQ